MTKQTKIPTTKNKPTTYRYANLRLNEWENKRSFNGKDVIVKTYTLDKTYFDDTEKQWKSTQSYGATDLLKLRDFLNAWFIQNINIKVGYDANEQEDDEEE